MNRQSKKIRTGRYYLPLTAVLFGMHFTSAVATTRGSAGMTPGEQAAVKLRALQRPDGFDVIHEQRVRFAADHGVADPAALVAAVMHSPMAHLLISVAIEESRGDPVAVGSSGEQGAWQVKSSSWGSVPLDIHGQAGQAERILTALLSRTNGNKIQALARYNGGSTPPGRSYRYAERILKRAGHLQVVVSYLPPKSTPLRQTLLDDPVNRWIL